MRELSLFADESGDGTDHTRHFLLTLVMHEQDFAITQRAQHYEEHLLRSGLPNIPFHSEPLLNGHGSYALLNFESRKKMLVAFNVLVQRLPIRYRSFVYKTSEFSDPDKLAARMRRDISALLFEHLDYFQAFNRVKIYYDNGQPIVRKALHESVDFALARQALVTRRTTMTDYRLAQAADYLCTMELAAIKYAEGNPGATYEKFFGSPGTFKRNWLKQARRKRL